MRIDNLTSAFMKKHLILFNKLVKRNTYYNVSKMKVDKVREIFQRDFREIVSGKDGKKFYAPKKYEFEIDEDEGGDSDNFFKLLSHPKGQKKKEEPKKEMKKKEEPKKEMKKKEEPKKEMKKKEEPKKEMKKKEEPKKKDDKLNDIVKQIEVEQSKIYDKKYNVNNLKKRLKNQKDIKDELKEINKINQLVESQSKKLNNANIREELKKNQSLARDLLDDKKKYEKRAKKIFDILIDLELSI